MIANLLLTSGELHELPGVLYCDKMVTTPHPRLSIVIPVYNEQEGIAVFHNQLSEVVQKVAHESYEIIYSDDGSSDNTATLIRDMAKSDHHIKLLCLSRNFGKEIALSAAIHMATGDAVIMLDGDGQHPVAMLPQFVEAWQAHPESRSARRTVNVA